MRNNLSKHATLVFKGISIKNYEMYKKNPETTKSGQNKNKVDREIKMIREGI